jgi:prevent-host-death family protein
MKEIRTVTATWARTHFGEIIRNTVTTGERFVVERDSIPVVVILSVSEYEGLQRQAAWSRFHELSRQAGLEAEEEGLTEAEIQAEIEAVKQQVYAERYGRG